MPTVNARDQGKTSFVKELLIHHPKANTKAVNEAWSAAGMQGTISETLVNKTRSHMGLAGNLRGKRRTETEAAASTKPAYTGKKRGRKPKQETAAIADGKAAPAGKRNDRLVELEADLDRLLFRVMSEGELAEVENMLREARKRLYAAFVTNR